MELDRPEVRARESASATTAMFLAAAAAAQDFDTPAFLYDQQRFHEQLDSSRWSANQMDYVDGASSAVLRNPYTLAFDPYDESLFVASFTLNHIVRLRLHEKRKAQYKVFVSGQDVDSPVGMVLDDGVLYVSSFTNDHVLRVGAQNGSLLGKFGNEDELDCPEGLALGPDGSIYVASFLLKHIARYEPRSGRYLGAFAPARDGSYEVSPSGALRWVASASAAEPPPLLGAEDLAFDHNGDLHVTAYWSNCIHKYNGTTGSFETAYGKGIVHGPVGITVGRDGDVYVAAYKDNKIMRFTKDGRFIGVAAGASTKHQRRPAISAPSGLAFADDGTLFVASYIASVVVRFNQSAGARTYVRVTD